MWRMQASPRWMQRMVNTSGREFDQGTLLGILISFVLISIGVVTSGKSLNFLSPSSLLVVLGGTVGATLVHFSTYDLKRAWKELQATLRSGQSHPVERISALVELSHAIRKGGMMVLEREAERTRDAFFKKALELTVDGQREADVRRILETEIHSVNERHSRAVQVLETMGNYAPAMGLIGTLIGLIQMLGALDNPALVGPAMSQALLTTFYGAILSNLVFLPMAGKMRARHDEDALVKAITIEGTISLLRQENAIVVEQRLQSFLPLCGARESAPARWR